MREILFKVRYFKTYEQDIIFWGCMSFVLVTCVLIIGCRNSPSNMANDEKELFIKKEAKSEKTISIRADYWFPFNGNSNDKQPGFIIEFAREIFCNAGYLLDYDIIPWSRAVASVRDGKFDGLVGAFKSDVPDFIFPDNEQGISKTIFMVRKDTRWRYDGISSLSNIRLGVIQDYGYGKIIDEYVERNKNDATLIDTISGRNVVKRNLERLMRGRIDAIIDVEPVLEHTIKEQRWADRFIKAGTASEDKVYIAFSPNNPKSKIFAKILSDGMLQLRVSGRYKTILSQYEKD